MLKLPNLKMPEQFEAEVITTKVIPEVKNFSIAKSDGGNSIQEVREMLKEKGVEVQNLKKRSSPIPAIIAFAITLVFCCVRYFEKDGFNAIRLFPSMPSLIISIALYASFVLRVKGIENSFRNILDTTVSIMFILVLASFIGIIAGANKIPSGFFGKLLKKLGLDTNYPLLITGLIFSWLGIKQISGIIWIVFMFLGFIEINTCGNYMGNFQGAAYLLSAFVGVVFYLKYEGRKIINSFKSVSQDLGRFVKNDTDESKRFIQEGITAAATGIEETAAAEGVPVKLPKPDSGEKTIESKRAANADLKSSGDDYMNLQKSETTKSSERVLRKKSAAEINGAEKNESKETESKSS